VRGARFLAWCCLVAWGMAYMSAVSAGAETADADSADAVTADVLQRAHAWARFGKGSWRHVRIFTETFDEQGKVNRSSVADNLTTLQEITPEGVTFKVEVTVEVAGQKFPSPAHVVQQGFAGETPGQTVSIKSLDDETLTIDGREIPCQAQQIEILGDGNKEVIQFSYSQRMTPPILKRRSTTSEAASGKTVQEAVTEVFALDRRLRLLDEPFERRGYRVRRVLTSHRGTTTTWSDHVVDIPGEVVTHSSQKFDEQGRLIRRTTLELVDYNAENRGARFRDLPRYKRRQQRRGR
jgi:hypothetical protein